MAAKVARGPRATPAVPKVRWPQVRGFRARRHFLEDPAPAGALLEAVARISGLHAQLLSSAELSARIAVSIEPFATFPAWVRRAVGEESERLARFFRLPVEGVR